MKLNPAFTLCSLMAGLALFGAKPSSAVASPVRDVLADYDAELRRPDGRVDVDAMVARLKNWA